MQMKKLAIVLTISVASMLGGCMSMLVPGYAEMDATDQARSRMMVANAFEKGFNRGFSRRMAQRSPVRYGTIKSKTTLSDGTTIRARTKYRTGGWRKTKIKTEIY